MICLMLLANGFEDTEALTTRDILLRGGVFVDLVSIDDDLIVKSSYSLLVMANNTLKKIDYKKYDCLILPGGGEGTKNLKESKEVAEIVKYFYSKNKVIGAICAAPSILGRLGYLKNRNYTCYKSCQEGEGLFSGKEVEKSDNIITARSMKYSIEFALILLEKLTSKENREKVENQILGK